MYNIAEQNSDYWIWNKTIVSPTRGYKVVTQLLANRPDNDPPQVISDGNQFALNVVGNFMFFMLHERQNSFTPEFLNFPGFLERQGIPDFSNLPLWPMGAPIAKVGNSGISVLPHLHLGFMWRDFNAEEDREAFRSVPAEFANTCWSRSEQGPFQCESFHVPAQGEHIRQQAGGPTSL